MMSLFTDGHDNSEAVALLQKVMSKPGFQKKLNESLGKIREDNVREEKAMRMSPEMMRKPMDF